ncbi:SESN1_3 [Mytilus coruscus]|uniref:SESN1_3 n=1 Tax=Mytilus coruscus TaxID=42192 RepID=A0A6J8C5W2_MYTCO|nr:SESN1_3 [Mytilus coruscus]
MYDLSGYYDNCSCNLNFDLINGNTEPVTVILPFCGMCNRNKYLQDSRKKSRLSKNDSMIFKEIIPVNTTEDQDFENKKTQMVFIDAFLQNNRLDHLTQLMGYHPTYLENFLRTQQYLLRGDGPLPFHYRHYIAIMAASRHQCTYLIHLHEEEFILQNGDPDWLKGPTHIPKKIRNLFELNKLMAHRPWLINKSHIDKLTRGKDNWSLSELMQAICLIAHFHAMCSFVYGCGVRNELDHNGESLHRRLSMSDDSDSDTQGNEPEVKIEVLMERMKKLNEDDSDDPTEEERLKRFESIENQSVELISSSIPSPRVEVLKYCEDPEFCYQDFAKRDNLDSIPTFRAQDYNWEEHGFSLANRLLSDIGSNLEDRFNIAINLTYYTMGKVKNVDTSAFRCAIWNYIHCLYGIMHDDFNYSQVNQLLDRNLKSYIKTVTCYPERLTKKDYDSCMQEFRHSEKVHVNLMLLEARLQGELLYSLRAVMQHMT